MSSMPCTMFANIVFKALGRLTEREAYDRQWRFKRASQASVVHDNLQREDWIKPEEVCILHLLRFTCPDGLSLERMCATSSPMSRVLWPRTRSAGSGTTSRSRGRGRRLAYAGCTAVEHLILPPDAPSSTGSIMLCFHLSWLWVHSEARCRSSACSHRSLAGCGRLVCLRNLFVQVPYILLKSVYAWSTPATPPIAPSANGEVWIDAGPQSRPPDSIPAAVFHSDSGDDWQLCTLYIYIAKYRHTGFMLS